MIGYALVEVYFLSDRSIHPLSSDRSPSLLQSAQLLLSEPIPVKRYSMAKRKNSETKSGLSVLLTNASIEDTEDTHACALRASRMMEEEAIIYSIKGLFRLASKRKLAIHPLHIECFKRVSNIFTQLISSLDSIKWSGGTRNAMNLASCCRVIKVNYDKPNLDSNGSIRCVACGTVESNEQYAIDFGGPYEPPFVLMDNYQKEFSSIRTRFEKFISNYTRALDGMEKHNSYDGGRYHVGCYCMHHMTLSWSLRRHFDTIYYNINMELDAKSNETALKDAWYLTRLAATTKSTIDLIEHARSVISSRSYIQKSAFPIDIDKKYWSRFQKMRQSVINQLERKHGISVPAPMYSHALTLAHNSSTDEPAQPHIEQLQNTINPKLVRVLREQIKLNKCDQTNSSDSESDSEEDDDDDEDEEDEQECERDEDADVSGDDSNDDGSDAEHDDDLAEFIVDDELGDTSQSRQNKRIRRVLIESDDEEQEDQEAQNDTTQPSITAVWEKVSLSHDNFKLLIKFLKSKFASPWSSKYASLFYEIMAQQTIATHCRLEYSTRLENIMTELANRVGREDGGEHAHLSSDTRHVIVNMKKEMVNKLQSANIPACFQEDSCVDSLVYNMDEALVVDMKWTPFSVITNSSEWVHLLKHTVWVLLQCDWTLHFERVQDDMYRTRFASLMLHLIDTCETPWDNEFESKLKLLTSSYGEFYNTDRDTNNELHNRIHKVTSYLQAQIHDLITFVHGVYNSTRIV